MNNNKPKKMNIVTTLLSISIFLLFVFYMGSAFHTTRLVENENQFIRWIIDLAPFVIGLSLSIIAIIICIKCIIGKCAEQTKAKIGLVIASIVSILFLFLFFSSPTVQDYINNSNSSNGLQRVCPDSWSEDWMPTVGVDGKELSADDFQKYKVSFIVNSAKIDTRKVDLDWVKENCSIKQPLIAL